MSNVPVEFDTRNILDAFRGLPVEEIKRRISRNNFSVGMLNFGYQINLGNMVRTVNALAGREFLIIGDRKWDRRSAVGTHHYETIVHLTDAAALKAWAGDRPIIAVDRVPGSVAINEVSKYPDSPVFLFGNEATGISQDFLDIAAMKVHIPQYGSVRSLNVSSACAMVLWDWCAKHLF